MGYSDGWHVECEGGTYECRFYKDNRVVDRFTPKNKSLIGALAEIDERHPPRCGFGPCGDPSCECASDK